MNTEPTKVPTCLGFIMDGNRRWAKAHGLTTSAGHQQGTETLKKLVAHFKQSGIRHVVFYAFSSENWRRSEAEVDALITLFSQQINKMMQELRGGNAELDGVRIKFIGNTSTFPAELQTKISEVEEMTAAGELTAWIALSYGGRAEIVAAANQAIVIGKKITEADFAKLLWTNDMPDPELIIRTGGQQRLSNFLPWQSVYSELVFIPEYWPDLTPARVDEILKDYTSRVRNFGK